MKVSEFAKELNVTSKEILAFLQENGFDYKSANKNLNDSEMELVRKAFGGKKGGEAKAEKKAEAVKEESDGKAVAEKKEAKAEKPENTSKEEKSGNEAKAEKPATPQAAVQKPADGKSPSAAPARPQAPAGGAGRPAGSAPAGPGGNPPIKKKKIIMVGTGIPQQRQNDSGMRPQPPHGAKPQTPNGAANVGKKPVAPQNGLQRPLIKPTTPPSAAPEIHFVPEKQQQRNSENKKQETVKPESQVTKVNAETKGAPVADAGITSVTNAQNAANTAVNRPEATPVQNTAETERREAPKPVDNQAQKPSQGGDRIVKPARDGGNGRTFERTNDRNQDRNRDRGDRFNDRGDRNGNRPVSGGRPGENRFGGNGRPQGQGGFNRQGGVFNKDGADGEKRSIRKPMGGKIFTADAPSVDNRKNDGKRRNNEKDKNKKNGKDFIYDEDGTMKGGKGKQQRAGAFIKPEKKPVVEEEEIKVISVPEEISIKELAEKMKLQANVIIKELFMKGEMVTLNDIVPFEKAEEIAMEHEILCEAEVKVNVIEELLKEEEEDPSTLTERPPVICVMGHVDHGKTSLLDAIRKTHVIQGEAGGITQHIGAYMVKVPDPETGKDRKITFLDTPGHEAFTAMRMRGANSTDIAILVVAADDGVMPQTKEAINHAKAAGVPIIVAVNKVDKIGFDFNDKSKTMDSYPGIAKLIRELADEHSLVWEEWGGETIFAPISAKQGQGIGELLEMILLSADMLELKANANRKARGLVIEAELDKGRGPVATVLVQKGTLRVGDFISAGEAHGKVRAMIDDKGRRLKEALPSTPVEILGLNGVPGAGEIFIAHTSDKEAKNFADTFIAQNKVKKIGDTKTKMSLDDLYSQIQAGNLKELNLIIKADVQGSVEAVKESLEKLSNEEVVVKVIHGGVGAINESDVVLASAAKAIIIGFNVRVDNMAKDTVEREGVDVRLYDVIYKAIEDVESAMKGMLEPIFEEKVIGHAEVRQIFKASAIGNIAGSFVLDGVFERGCLIRITRGGEQVYEGKLASLKRFKDDVKEVKAGFECGLVFENFGGMEELDIVEAYKMVEVPRT